MLDSKWSCRHTSVVKTLRVFVEDLSLVPSTCDKWLTSTPYSVTSSGLHRQMHLQVHILHIGTGIHMTRKEELSRISIIGTTIIDQAELLAGDIC